MAINQSVVDSILKSMREDYEKKEKRGRDTHLLLIDGLNTFIRGFAVNPSMNDDGIHIGGIVAMLNSIGYAIRQVRPTRCIVIFDGRGGSKRRKKLLPEYKEGRSRGNYNRSYDLEDSEKAKIRQIARVLEYLKALPVSVVQIDNIEADDSIAYIAQQVYDESDITIMSTDKDFLQLVDDRVTVYSPSKKVHYTKGMVEEDYGFPARNFLLYRLMEGDKSDNIEGVYGIGPKTVQKKFHDLIWRDERQTVKDLLEYAEKHKDESATYERVLMEENKEIIKRNWKLMQLYEVDISLQKKREIMNAVQAPVPDMNGQMFRKMFMEDKLWSAFHSIDSWLKDTFLELQNYTKKQSK